MFVDAGQPNARTHMRQFDGSNHETRTYWDFAGRAFLVQNAGANFGAIPSPPGPSPHAEMMTYDALSQVISVFDGDGGETRMQYDGLGRLIQRELVARQESISTFNTKDVFERNAFGQVVSARSFTSMNGGGAVGAALDHGFPFLAQSTVHDSIGRVHAESFQFGFATNVPKVESSFGLADRFRSGLTYHDGLPTGGPQLALQYTPDALRRLAAVHWSRATPSAPSAAVALRPLVAYTWHGGLRSTRTTTIGSSSTTAATSHTAFEYDPFGRLTRIEDTVTAGTQQPVVSNRFDYAYDAAGNLTKESYGKVGGRRGDRFTYDAYHRLQSAYMGLTQSQMDAATDPTAFVPSEMVKQESFTLDAAQNRVAVATRTGAATFYDAYEVEDGASGGPSNRYTQAAGALQTHDLRGNLTYDGRFYYRYDYCNRLQEVWQVAPVDATAVGVDETFVPVQDVEALEDSRKEAYEDVNNLLHRVPREHMDPVFRGRLRKTIVGGVVRVNGSPSGGGMPRFVEPANLVLVALYGYDAWNRRVMRAVVGQGTWLSAYDGWREVAEHELDMVSFAAPATKQFVHGSRLDEVVSYRRKVGGAWEDYYLQHGGQDTAAKLLDQSGAVVEQYEYDAYGKATVYGQGAVAASATSAKGLPMLWKGIRLDPETGLLYMRNRYYSTATGRFLSGDPIGAWGDAVGSGNGYQYAGSRPGAMGDPFGLQAEPTSAIGQTFTDTLRAVDLGWEVGSLYLDGKLSLAQHREWVDKFYDLLGSYDNMLEQITRPNSVFCKGDRQFAGVLRDEIKRILKRLDEGLELHEEAEALKREAVILGAGFISGGVVGWLMRPVGAVVRGGGIAARGAAAAGKFSRNPKSLMDRMVLDAAKQGKGTKIIDNLGDPKFKGMEKWSYTEKSASGLRSEVHYVRDPKTGQLMDFKFTHHAEAYK